MGHWNHRVVKKTYNKGGEYEETLYQIHETFYGLGDAREPNPAITNDPISPMGESVESLRETLLRMLACLDKPVLDYDSRKEIEPGPESPIRRCCE